MIVGPVGVEVTLESSLYSASGCGDSARSKRHTR